MKTRIYFLDNLRTVLIFLVVVLHAGLVYEPVLKNTWIVWDPSQIKSIGLVRMYLDLFVMFVIFFISGYFVPTSLKSKTNWGFLKSKFKRIMIPWLVAVFTLIPAYKAIFLYSRGLPQEEWYSYFHIFQRAGSDLSFYANNPTQNWLWFLPALFLFQVAYLGLSKTKLLSIKVSLKTAVIITFLVGVIYSMVISSADLRGWFHSPLLHFQRERILIYFMSFLLGTLCYKLKVFESTQKNKKVYIWSNVALTISLGIFTAVALNFFFNIVDPARNHYFVSETIDRVLYYSSALISMLSFLYILIHGFRFSFNKSNPLMSHLNKYSYSVYIIHVVVMGIIAVVLLNLAIPALVKFLILIIMTFIVSNLLVGTFRRVFQTILSTKIVTVVIPAVAILLAVLVYTKQSNSSAEHLQVQTIQTTKGLPEINIFEAAFNGDINAIEQHILAGSDLNAKDAYGSTPLIIAAIFGKTEVAIALIEAGSDLSIRNNEGSTPLHIAAFYCRTEIVKALLENGADKNLKNAYGSTALESVSSPFEEVKGVYDQLGKALGPFGLELDYDRIEKTRPVIAEMLSSE